MSELRRFLLRLKTLLFPSRAERDLSREIDTHIELQAEAYRRRGLPAEEARRKAVQALGGREQTKELHRGERSFQWLEQARQDLRYALRSFRHSPVFTAVVVGILAIGIGANTAIFSVINSVLIKPLPYNDPDRIVRVIQTTSGSGSDGPQSSSVMRSEDFELWRERTRAFSAMALYDPLRVTFANDETATRLTAAAISPAMFAVLGASPALGRAFRPDEETPGNGNVSILSYSAWQRLFGGDPDILGRSMALDNQNRTIVGVMPQDFAFPDRETEVWVPLELRGRLASGVRTGQCGQALMRLADGVSLSDAGAEAAVAFRQILAERSADEGGRIQLRIATLQDDLVAPVRPALVVLGVGAGFILLIVCVNVANLMLVRASSRGREFAVRLALGAGRSRLVRQTLTESLLLAVAGGGIGTMLAFGGVRLLARFGPDEIPRLAGAAVDSTAMGVALFVSLTTGVLFGTLPASHSFSPDVVGVFRRGPGARANPLQRGFENTRSSLIVSQVTLAFVLVVGAGLLFSSFLRLSSVDPGYDVRNVLTFRVPLPFSRYSDQDALALYSQLTTRLENLPGVQEVGSSFSLPLEPYDMNLRFWFDATADPYSWTEEEFMTEFVMLPTADIHTVSANYLEALGVRLVAGRSFTEADREGQPLVGLVNETLARRYLGDGIDPVGRDVSLGRLNGVQLWWRIVGVVGDVRQDGLDREPVPELFFHYGQILDSFGGNERYFALRTAGPPADRVPSVRAAVLDLDPQLPIDDVATLGQRGSEYVRLPRFYALTIGAFAAVALALAATGIAGVTAYSVSQRSREIGIRLALGAGRGNVLRLILGRSGRLTALGLCLGLAGTFALTRYLESLLFEVTPFDLTTVGGASLTLLLVAAAATYIPARHASRLDPAETLRQE